MAKWQFTLSATQANAEVRVARVHTGREKIVVFDGKYHGQLEPTLAVVEDGRILPEYTACVSRSRRIFGLCLSTAWMPSSVRSRPATWPC